MRNGGLWRRILCLRWKFQANMFIRFEKYSTVFALSSKAERPGGLCPMTCRPGRWCIIGLAAGCGPGAEALAEDLRTLLGLAEGRNAQPSAAFIDSQTLRLTPESGARAGYDGGKRKKGSKLHLAVDTLGHFLAVHVTPANADDRAEVGQMAKAIQAATDQSVEVAFLDQGYTGDRPARAAQEHGIELDDIFWLGVGLSSVSEGLSGRHTCAAWQRCNSFKKGSAASNMLPVAIKSTKAPQFRAPLTYRNVKL